MKMNAKIRFIAGSIVAISKGLAAYFVAGGVVFGAIYFVLVYLLPKPDDWVVLRSTLNLLWGLLIGEAVGSIASGYVMFRIVSRARYINSAMVIALLSAMRQAYVLWGPNTPWALEDDPLLPTILVCLPFFVLGAWMGSRKRGQIEKLE
jgi:hypothetical protein